jgi:hypothetical protein
MAKKEKVARLEIRLPDGTHVIATGPMAQEMARRALTPEKVEVVRYPWYTWWGTRYATTKPYITTTTGSFTTTDVAGNISSGLDAYVAARSALN